jgi:hypothetical protein
VVTESPTEKEDTVEQRQGGGEGGSEVSIGESGHSWQKQQPWRKGPGAGMETAHWRSSWESGGCEGHCKVYFE